MASHNQLGKAGENLAAKYLFDHGFIILHRNWRYSYYEIDIIAEKDDVLHIVEVKSLTSSSHGYPEDAVTRKKFQCLLQAADEFLYQNPKFKHVSYDILSIIKPKGKAPEFFFIEDVYY